MTKCEEKFEAKRGTLTQKAADALDPCPDGLLPEEVKEAVDEHVAAGLDGEGPSDCSGDLLSCEGGLAACQAAAQGQRLKTDQTQCWNESNALVSCTGTGQDSELQTGLTVSFADNDNGTISDNRTGLMWERLNDGGGINDEDAVFDWTNASNKVKVLNGDATGCIGAGNPCSCCTGPGTGSCIAFAGHTAWRLPNLSRDHDLPCVASVTATSSCCPPSPVNFRTSRAPLLGDAGIPSGG